VSRFIHHHAECRYAECRYAECHYAECLHAECRGASENLEKKKVADIIKSDGKWKN
jgi:hypothetical protein